MQELIKIKRNERMGIETVNARDLYEFLGVKSRFNDWINNRINKYEFVENIDYVIVTKKLVTEANDYFISLDMSKELSMVENNEKGKQARRYFIEIEKKSKALSVPQNFSQALRLAANLQEQNERLLEIQQIQEPKVKVYDTIIDSKDLLSMDKVAKIIDAGMGRNNLFKKLREEHILMKDNTPYQEYVNRGYFKIKEGNFTTNTGNIKITKTTYTTQVGLVYLQKKLMHV